MNKWIISGVAIFIAAAIIVVILIRQETTILPYGNIKNFLGDENIIDLRDKNGSEVPRKSPVGKVPCPQHTTYLSYDSCTNETISEKTLFALVWNVTTDNCQGV